MLDVHALQVFYEAARTGSFTAAARVLSITQPAVSMQIKTLEDYLQVELFSRNGRSIRLTKAGEALVPMAQQIIDLTIQTEHTIRTANSEVVGNLVIGCSVPSANQVLIHVAARFQKLYPNVRISVPSVSRQELDEKLIGGIYDFGVMNVINRCENMGCQPFFDDQIVLIAPPSHPFAKRRTIKPQDLLAERFVCHNRGSACRYAVGDALEPYNIDVSQLDVVMELGSPNAILAAVEHGIGLSFMSLLDVSSLLAQGRISIIDVQGIHLSTSVQIGYSEHHLSSLVQLKFKGFIEHPQTVAQIQLLTQGYRLGQKYA